MANKIYGNGMLEADFVDLIVALRAAILGIQTKLDSDTGVNDTDYHTAATTALAALPSGIQTTGVKCIHNQGVITSILSDIATKWNATLTKLDSDSQVTDVNFNSLWAITALENGSTKSIPVGNSKIDGIFDAGQYQSSIVAVLNTILASINGVAAKLDLDGGVTDTNYGALWAITDTVIEGGTSQRIRPGGTSSFLWALLALSALFGSPRPMMAANIVEGDIFNSSATINQFPTFDSGMIDRLSAQASYTNGTPSGLNFTDGRKSTDTLTVVSTLTLTGLRGTNTLTVASNTLTGAIFTLNGYPFTNGGLWTAQSLSTQTASNIATAINGYSPLNTLVSAVAVSSVVTITCISSGTACNSYTLVSSTPAALTTSTANFSGGVDHAAISINGVTLTEGVQWTNGPTTTATALNIASAILNSSQLLPVVTATNTATVVFATSALVGVNAYATFSSSPTALRWSAPIFANGLAADYAGSTFTKTNHGFVTGLQVLMASVTATTSIGGLNAGTTYFVSSIDVNTFGLATSTTNAVARTVITVSSTTGGDTWSLTPSALTIGSAGMFWQMSNDNLNWSNEPTVTFSSVTYSAAGNSAWDFQFQNYRYLRANVTAPTTGAILWKIRIRGKGDFN